MKRYHDKCRMSSSAATVVSVANKGTRPREGRVARIPGATRNSRNYVPHGPLFGVHRAQECLAYATGFVSIGDSFNDGYIPGGVTGAVLPFAIQVTDPVRFAVPVPCNTPVRIQLQTFADAPIDDKPCSGFGGDVGLSRGQVCSLLGVLTDDTNPPSVTVAPVSDGATDVDPLAPLDFSFSESLDPASVTGEGAVPGEVLDANGNAVKGHWEISPDGRVVTFVPDIRLHYGQQYTLRLGGVRDTGGNTLASQFTATFTTFEPQIVQHIEVDARDVAWLDPQSFPPSANLSPCTDLIAVAEGDSNPERPDFVGGIRIYDVTDLSVPPPLVASAATSGTDRAVVFVPGPPITTTGQDATTLNGPFLMSIDGGGASDRFGTWRLFNLEHFPSIEEAATRLINQSGDSWNTLNFPDPLGGPPPQFLYLIPNDLGVPEDLSATDTQIAYIANAPFIGIQGIALQNINTDYLGEPQVDATLTGQYRSVGQFGNYVLGLRQDGASNVLVLANPPLATAANTPLITGTYPLSGSGRPLSVTALRNWPSRTSFEDATTTPMDLAVAPGAGGGVTVVPVNANGTFDNNRATTLAVPNGGSGSAVGDAVSQLLFVADGTAGLRIIDLAAPVGERDDDHDGTDDRLLSTVGLDGARALRVAFFRDVLDRLIAVVASDKGLSLVSLGPGSASVGLVESSSLRTLAANGEAPGNDTTTGRQFDQGGGPQCKLVDGAGLAISTIASDSSWPGPRPAGLGQCLGYQDGILPDNDDQIVVDVMLHVSSALSGLIVGTAAVEGYELVNPGALTNCSDAQKQWLVLAFLVRSTNGSPPDPIPNVDVFEGNGDYRILNEFGVRGLVPGGQIEKQPTRRRADIGPTPFRLFHSVELRFRNLLVHADELAFTVPAGEFPSLALNTADRADRNDALFPENPTSTYTHRAAGRIGRILEPFERALLPLRAPPFASELTMTLTETGITITDQVSQQFGAPDCIWPTASIYTYKPELEAYEQTGTRKQGPNPNACFVGFGTPWTGN